MPRSRKGVPRQEPEPPALVDNEWGSDPSAFEEREDDYELGDLPPPPVAAQERSTPPSERLAALGPPPEGALAAEKWAHRMLMWQAYETMMSDLPETVRRKEVRTILRDAKGHMTDAARYDYMRVVEADQAEMENKKRGRAAAHPVAVTPGTAAKIIPIRRDG